MNEKKKLSAWMIENGFTTGHGDTFDDLLRELDWQIIEMRDKYHRVAGVVQIVRKEDT